MPDWAMDDLLRGPVQLTKATGVRFVATTPEAPGTTTLRVRSLEVPVGVRRFEENVEAQGGFGAFDCVLTDLSFSAGEGLNDRERGISERAGASDVGEFKIQCKGDSVSSDVHPIIVHAPSHSLYAKGSIPGPLAQIGKVSIDGYEADPGSVFRGELAKLREATPAFVNLGKLSKLRISGYKSLQLEGEEWHVRFRSTCPDQGFGCDRDEGVAPTIELVEARPCDVTGYTYP